MRLAMSPRWVGDDVLFILSSFQLLLAKFIDYTVHHHHSGIWRPIYPPNISVTSPKMSCSGLQKWVESLQHLKLSTPSPQQLLFFRLELLPEPSIPPMILPWIADRLRAYLLDQMQHLCHGTIPSVFKLGHIQVVGLSSWVLWSSQSFLPLFLPMVYGTVIQLPQIVIVFFQIKFPAYIHTNRASTKFQVDWTSSGSTVKCSKMDVLWTLLKLLSPPNDTPIFCEFLHNNTAKSSEIWRDGSYWLTEIYYAVFMEKAHSLNFKIEFNDFTVSLSGGWL